jgi:NADPH:quinone reductase-like Zn-dependent oxidoreductase
MRAIQYTAFGGPEVLQLVDVPVPDPGPGRCGSPSRWRA